MITLSSSCSEHIFVVHEPSVLSSVLASVSVVLPWLVSCSPTSMVPCLPGHPWSRVSPQTHSHCVTYHGELSCLAADHYCHLHHCHSNITTDTHNPNLFRHSSAFLVRIHEHFYQAHSLLIDDKMLSSFLPLNS